MFFPVIAVNNFSASEGHAGSARDKLVSVKVKKHGGPESGRRGSKKGPQDSRIQERDSDVPSPQSITDTGPEYTLGRPSLTQGAKLGSRGLRKS